MKRFCLFAFLSCIPILWLLPIWAGYQAARNDFDSDIAFLGWIRSDDFHRYGSFIDQTRFENRLVYWDYSAVEPQNPRMIALFFFLLGIIGKISALSAQNLWLLSHFFAPALFLLSLFYLVRHISNSGKFHLTALGMVLFSGGIEFICSASGIVYPRMKNFWMDGFSSFCSFHNPLKIAGITSVVLLILAWELYLKTSKAKFLFLSMLLIPLAWLIHPNSAIPGYIAVFASVFCCNEAHHPSVWSMKRLYRFIPLLLPLMAIGVYILWMKTDPTTANIIRQYNIGNLTEPVRFYPIRYGIVLPLGIIGLAISLKKPNTLICMLTGWWGGAEFFAHFSGMSGLLFQHMIHLPMALFASLCLVKILDKSLYCKHCLPIILGLTFAGQNAFILLKVIDQTRHDVWPTSLFWSTGEIRAAIEFRNYTRGNVLVSRDSGNKVGWLALKPVLLGHWGTTPLKGLKENEVRQFFDNHTDSSWKQRLLQKYNIDYVWFGHAEREMGAVDPLVCQEVLIANQDVMVFKVALKKN